MPRRAVLALLLVLCPFSAAGAALRPAPAELPAARPVLRSTAAAPTYQPGELLVVMDHAAATALGSNRRVAPESSVLASVLSRHGLERYEPIGGPSDAAERAGVAFLKLTSARSDFDPLAAAADLRATGAFRAVMPNYELKLATIPNDEFLGYQYYVNDAANADIQLPEAWSITTGSMAVTIGIMDTGVDLGHPDLATQIWTNTGEIAGNGIDDDHDGYIDDAHGWDFGDGDKDPNPEPMFDEIGLDEAFHGTFVASLAAAATNNYEGMAGAGWRCRVMPLKVSDATGAIHSDYIAAAFQYAADHHVSVLNMSFGAPNVPGVPEYFQALVDMATAANVVCVAAAGNDSVTTPSYPAATNGVLAVGATDETNHRAYFSNWGSWVDVCAPGTTMLGAINRNYTLDDLTQTYFFYYFGWDGETPYMFGNGTSFAAPLVSGVCGLVRSRFPTLTPAQVIARMVATGDVIVSDHPVGRKVNAYKAVNQALNAVPALAGGALALAAAPNPFVESSDVRFTLPRAASARLGVYDLSGRRVRVLADGAFAAGAHDVAWDGLGADGRRLGAGVFFIRLESAGAIETLRAVRLK